MAVENIFTPRWPFSEQEMIEAHQREIDRCEATVYNLGWGMCDDGIESKTSLGILVTTRLGPHRYEHRWLK